MNKKIRITIYLAVLAISILAAALYFNRDKLGFAPSIQKEETGKGGPVVPEMKKMVRKELAALDSESETTEDFLKKPEFRKPFRTALTKREKNEEEMSLFFDYLDQKGYAAKYKIKGGMSAHFQKIVKLLMKNPPVIVGETKDVYILTRNMAHFYRVAKLSNISLIKEILVNEKDVIEPALGMMYEWVMEMQAAAKDQSSVTMENLYEYAAYFTDTVSGKAYLMRRDSRTRLLVSYYSILVLSRADRAKLNRYGIDILPHIDRLVEDMENYSTLEHRKDYIETLKEIRKAVSRGRG